MNSYSVEVLVTSLGWTLVHFLWQGAAIALWLALCLRLMRKTAANQRYLAGCAAMVAMALAPLVTFNHISAKYAPPPAPLLAGNSSPAPTDGDFSAKPAVIVRATSTKAAVAASVPATPMERVLPWLVMAWAAGVLVLSTRLLVGWLQLRRLKRAGNIPIEEMLQERLAILAGRLKLSRPVRLLQSALVEVPTVIGWLRPVILLPAGCLTGLSPEQLESILAHELAHIRRHDYLVNLLQSAVETLLFYHPAVWWVSQRVRQERENCCDDLAVRVCGDRVEYARALATLEEMRSLPAQLSLAAGGAPLLKRIRRLTGRPDKEVGRPGWLFATTFALTAALALVIALRGNRAMAQEQNKPATATTAPENRRESSTGQLLTQADKVRAKLEEIHIPSLEFDAVPLNEAIRQLSDSARKNDPEHEGVSMVIADGNIDPTSGQPLSSTGDGGAISSLTGTPGAFTPLPPPGASVPTMPGIVDPKTGASSRPKAAPGGIDPTTGMPVGGAAPQKATLNGVSVRINPALKDVRLADALDAIVKTADKPIQYVVLESGVVFSPRLVNPDQLSVQLFKVDSIKFEKEVQCVTGKSYRIVNTRYGPSSGTVDPGVIREYVASLGVDLDKSNRTNLTKSALFDDRTGTLIVHATGAEIDKVGKALAKSLASQPQITVKAKIIEMDADDGKGSKSSVDWYLGNFMQYSTNVTPAPTVPIFPGAMHTNGPLLQPPLMTNSIHVQFTGILTPLQYQAVLKALEQRSGVNVLSAPVVTTLSGRKAQIMIGETMPVITGVNGPASQNLSGINRFTKQDVSLGTTLDIIPNLLPDEYSIQMTLIPSVSEFVGYERPGTNGVPGTPTPRFRLRQLTANVVVFDGQTIVLGGWSADEVAGKEHSKSQTPAHGATTKRRNLLVFVTPILTNPDGNPYHSQEQLAAVRPSAQQGFPQR